mgnify:CR=1 FL=1
MTVDARAAFLELPSRSIERQKGIGLWYEGDDLRVRGRLRDRYAEAEGGHPFLLGIGQVVVVLAARGKQGAEQDVAVVVHDEHQPRWRQRGDPLLGAGQRLRGAERMGRQ